MKHFKCVGSEAYLVLLGVFDKSLSFTWNKKFSRRNIFVRSASETSMESNICVSDHKRLCVMV